MIDNKETESWDLVIRPRSSLFDLHLKEVWRYKDLISLFIKRDFAAQYKQTILGPVWHLVQPILTTAIFLLLFGKIANIPTDGVQPVLILYERYNPLELFFSISNQYIQYFCNQCSYIRESIFSPAGYSFVGGIF